MQIDEGDGEDSRKSGSELHELDEKWECATRAGIPHIILIFHPVRDSAHKVMMGLIVWYPIGPKSLTGFIGCNGVKKILIRPEYLGIFFSQFLYNPQCGGGIAREVVYLREIIE